MLGHPRDIYVDGVRHASRAAAVAVLKVPKGRSKDFTIFLDQGGGDWFGHQVFDVSLEESGRHPGGKVRIRGLAGVLAEPLDMENAIDDERMSKPHALLSRVCHHSLGVRR